MVAAEKIRIRFNKLLSNGSFQFVFWELTLLFYVFITGENNIFRTYSNMVDAQSVYLVITYISLFTSLLFSFIDFIFTDRIMRFFPIRLMVLLKSSLYFISGFLIIIVAAIPSINIFSTHSYNELIIELPATNIHLFRFLSYYYVSCFLNSLLKGTLTKIGRGNFNNWFFGMLNKPREEERIFMFIDLKSSTTIAEKLLHKKFSHLIQDVFNDMAVVDNYGGEIYNYIGDGAIISWTLKKGLKRGNFIKAFYAFAHVLNKRKRYYQRKYKLEPKFKAGVHVGKVMVLQVGQIKRDISYNGDTMNTAARIESKCNEFKQNLLISGDLYDLIDDKKAFRYKNVGNIQLRGKKRGVDIYAVKQKA